MGRRSAVLSLLLGTLAAAGCGADSPRQGTAKPAYLARVNGICARYNALQRAAGRPTGTLDQQTATVRRFNALVRAEVAAVREVSPPPGDEERIAELQDEVTRAADLGDASTQLIASDVRQATRRATEAFTLIADANRKFAAYGLTVCAR